MECVIFNFLVLDNAMLAKKNEYIKGEKKTFAVRQRQERLDFQRELAIDANQRFPLPERPFMVCAGSTSNK